MKDARTLYLEGDVVGLVLHLSGPILAKAEQEAKQIDPDYAPHFIIGAQAAMLDAIRMAYHADHGLEMPS